MRSGRWLSRHASIVPFIFTSFGHHQVAPYATTGLPPGFDLLTDLLVEPAAVLTDRVPEPRVGDLDGSVGLPSDCEALFRQRVEQVTDLFGSFFSPHVHPDSHS